MTTLKIGGPLAIRCPVCDAKHYCEAKSGRYFLRKPHAARVKAAPPEQEVKVGDIVILCPGPPFPDALAILVDAALTGGLVQVRTWRHERWGLVVPVHPSVILRLAPENAQTAAMRATLAAEGRAT